MPGVVLQMTVEGGGVIRQMGRGFARARKMAMLKVGEFWHANLLPSHFGPANRSRFQHERRSPFYLQTLKPLQGQGQGRFVDNVLKGRSKRFMQAFYSVSATKDRATVTMRPPAYFAKPFIGSFVRNGVTKRITRQPDKPREVTTVDRRDAKTLSEYAAKEIAFNIAAEKAARDFRKLF